MAEELTSMQVFRRLQGAAATINEAAVRLYNDGIDKAEAAETGRAAAQKLLDGLNGSK